MVVFRVENIWKLLRIPHFLFISTKEVSPIIGRFVNVVPRLAIKLLDALIGGSGVNSDVSPGRFPALAAHETGGTSLQNMLHWEKNVRTDKFA